MVLADVKSTKEKKSSARSRRAGLIFPVGRVGTQLRKRCIISKNRKVSRVSPGAAVYLAAVMEYLAAEVLELSGNSCKDNKRKRVIPRDIVLAVKGDLELAEMLDGVTISQGGVVPSIHPALIRAQDEKKKKRTTKKKIATPTTSVEKQPPTVDDTQKDTTTDTTADTTADAATNAPSAEADGEKGSESSDKQ